MKDRGGVKVYLMGDARSVLTELATDERFAQTHVATASSCDEPEWAFECLKKFTLDEQGKTAMGSVFHSHNIYKASSKQVVRLRRKRERERERERERGREGEIDR